MTQKLPPGATPWSQARKNAQAGDNYMLGGDPQGNKGKQMVAEAIGQMVKHEIMRSKFVQEPEPPPRGSFLDYVNIETRKHLANRPADHNRMTEPTDGDKK